MQVKISKINQNFDITYPISEFSLDCVTSAIQQLGSGLFEINLQLSLIDSYVLIVDNELKIRGYNLVSQAAQICSLDPQKRGWVKFWPGRKSIYTTHHPKLTSKIIEKIKQENLREVDILGNGITV